MLYRAFCSLQCSSLFLQGLGSSMQGSDPFPQGSSHSLQGFIFSARFYTLCKVLTGLRKVWAHLCKVDDHLCKVQAILRKVFYYYPRSSAPACSANAFRTLLCALTTSSSVNVRSGSKYVREKATDFLPGSIFSPSYKSNK